MYRNEKEIGCLFFPFLGTLGINCDWTYEGSEWNMDSDWRTLNVLKEILKKKHWSKCIPDFCKE